MENLLIKVGFLTLNNNMKEETKDKIKKSKEENSRKLTEFYGYEIWIDSRNFVTVKDREQHYYSSLYQLFYNINLEVNQRGIKEKDLNNIAKKLESQEEQFLADLKDCLGRLCLIEPDELLNKLK